MLKTRIATALVLIALLMPALFWGDERVWQALILMVTLLAGWEWARLAGLRQPWAQWGYALLVAAFSGWGFDAPLQSTFGVWLGVVWGIVAPMALFLYVRSPHSPPFRSPVPLLLLGGMILFAFSWGLLQALVHFGPQIVLWWMAMVWLADIGGYFAGRRWGRHRLAQSISPGKTWEGWAGGMALALAGALAGAMLFSRYGFDGWQAALLGVIAGVSVVGDLLESALKRWAGMKDSSRILPGHGGVLDRLDSLLFALPWMWLIATWGGAA